MYKSLWNRQINMNSIFMFTSHSAISSFIADVEWSQWSRENCVE